MISQTYGHDRYGNHYVSASSGYAPNSLTPTASTAFNTANNQLVAQSYDNRGNQTSFTPYTLAYDGDDQQMSATSAQNGSASYRYDSDGQRVVKMTCSGGTPCTSGSSNLTTTVYVYDAMGQEAAEYSTQAPTTGGTQYYTLDHLGSTRMLTDSGGNVLARHDYLPFGEELYATTNGRSNLYPSVPGGGMLYTGQMRDSESGLDFFNARYFSGPQARFTGPDGPFNDQDPSDPQSWNLYTYVRNDPLDGTDPSGEDDSCVAGQPCTVNVTGSAGSVGYIGGDPSLNRVLYGILNWTHSVVQNPVVQYAQWAIDWLRHLKTRTAWIEPLSVGGQMTRRT